MCREIAPGPKKDRWHPLFTTSDIAPDEVLGLYRERQHHEQSYRVGVHDAGLDAVPCRYDKSRSSGLASRCAANDGLVGGVGL